MGVEPIRVGGTPSPPSRPERKGQSACQGPEIGPERNNPLTANKFDSAKIFDARSLRSLDSPILQESGASRALSPPLGGAGAKGGWKSVGSPTPLGPGGQAAGRVTSIAGRDAFVRGPGAARHVAVVGGGRGDAGVGQVERPAGRGAAAGAGVRARELEVVRSGLERGQGAVLGVIGVVALLGRGEVPEVGLHAGDERLLLGVAELRDRDRGQDADDHDDDQQLDEGKALAIHWDSKSLRGTGCEAVMRRRITQSPDAGPGTLQSPGRSERNCRNSIKSFHGNGFWEGPRASCCDTREGDSSILRYFSPLPSGGSAEVL